MDVFQRVLVHNDKENSQRREQGLTMDTGKHRHSPWKIALLSLPHILLLGKYVYLLIIHMLCICSDLWSSRFKECLYIFLTFLKERLCLLHCLFISLRFYITRCDWLFQFVRSWIFKIFSLARARFLVYLLVILICRSYLKLSKHIPWFIVFFQCFHVATIQRCVY